MKAILSLISPYGNVEGTGSQAFQYSPSPSPPKSKKPTHQPKNKRSGREKTKPRSARKGDPTPRKRVPPKYPMNPQNFGRTSNAAMKPSNFSAIQTPFYAHRPAKYFSPRLVLAPQPGVFFFFHPQIGMPRCTTSGPVHPRFICTPHIKHCHPTM